MITTDSRNEKDQIITQNDLPALKKSYDKAVKESKDIFGFKGVKILTVYVKHLIDFMNKK